MNKSAGPGGADQRGHERTGRGPALSGPYVAAKAGLGGLTRNAAHAHRWDRIRIYGLNIGWTDTEGEDATQRRFHAAALRGRSCWGVAAGRTRTVEHWSA